MNKKTIFFTIFSLFLSSFVFFMEPKKLIEPEEIYHVYLAGETLGYIRSEDKLEKYIDQEQSELKKQYKVDKVYAPNNLDIMKELTFDQKISKEEEIYETIKEKSPFTVNGYIATIEGTEYMSEDGQVKDEDQIIYVLSKDLFTDSVMKAMGAFISEDKYTKFVNHTQAEITNTGTRIEDVYITNKITIKQGKISTENLIFTNEDDLTKYLLFGTLEKQKEYVVKKGEDVEDIAYKNKLSVEEFLIANTDIKSSDTLLYAGQKVNLGLIKPTIKYVEEDHVVEVETVKYETKIEYDNNLLDGIERIKQQGSNGQQRVTRKVQKVNGEIKSVVTTKTETIKPVVNKIIVKGNKHPEIGNLGYWAWPTAKPYTISSPYAYRWGKLHEGIDISGTGYGSPIYAANNGVVVVAGYNATNGNYIYIDHRNGYYSVYAHLASINVSVNQVVSMGQKIGTMGQSGYAFGTHLHFSIFYGYPFRAGSYTLNPMRFY